MNVITIIVIALALAADAFAVSVASGTVYKQLKVKHAFRLALFFGFFQAFMPLIGSLAGRTISEYIDNYAHWVIFSLLSAIGCKMIYESFKIKPESKNPDPLNIIVLLVLSVATSIDALVVGVTLSLLTTSILTAAVIIGLVTFLLSYIGVFIGKKFGHFFENKIEAVGGIILLALGLKILLEKLFF